MHKEYIMGNTAIALGAMQAGVNLVCGYPGTPSSEVLETIAKKRTGDTYVEWSVNEKAAMEVAYGASLAGARVLVTMKQMGLNVASDPLMSLEYVGTKGAMVVLVADDPGPISSQTEQDTRTYAMYSKIPCFDPSSAQEAYEMIQEAFELSEKWGTPVLFRPTTRVCHGYAAVEIQEPEDAKMSMPSGFERDTTKWVIFPGLSHKNHKLIEERNEALADQLSEYPRNYIVAESHEEQDKAEGKKLGIVSSGISYTYVDEILASRSDIRLLKISTPFPFPEKLALEFLQGLDQVLCIEELDPYLERALTHVCGKYNLPVEIFGKMSHHIAYNGENQRDTVKEAIESFAGCGKSQKICEGEDVLCPPDLPTRPPVLCAGCPHRASFYAVKVAMKGYKTAYCGDIGCYTLGNAMPLDMVDTCLCMGAGVTMAQGINRMDPDTVAFAFLGDSTFFASGLAGVANAVYNQANITLVILDNSTTAMTGHQPHPGTGKTMMGQVVEKIHMEKVLEGLGVETVKTVDPLNLYEAIDVVKETALKPGVKAIIFKSPCIALVKPDKPMTINQNCTNCRQCITKLGCPAITVVDEKVVIDQSLCTGCGLCTQVCPFDSIQGGESHE